MVPLFLGVARIFERLGCHTVSHPGYVPECHVNIHASCVLLKVTFYQRSSERGGRGERQAYNLTDKLICSNPTAYQPKFLFVRQRGSQAPLDPSSYAPGLFCLKLVGSSRSNVAGATISHLGNQLGNWNLCPPVCLRLTLISWWGRGVQ